MTCWVCTLTVKVPVTLSKELPAGFGLRSARTINLPAGLGLHSANSSDLSADVGLRTASQNSNRMFQLIVRYVFTVRFKQQYQRKPQQDFVDVWSSNAISNVNLQTTNNFQQGFASHFNKGFFFKFIINSVSEGARTPLSMLIVGYRYSKIFLHFCGNCRIFCEGVKGNENGIIKPQSANYHNMAIKLVKFIGRVGHTNGLVGHNIQIQAQLIVVTASLLIVVSASQLIVASASVNTNTKIPFTAFDWQKIFKGTCLNGLNGADSLVGFFADFSGFCLISLIHLSRIIGLVGQTSLVGLIGLVGHNCLGNQNGLIKPQNPFKMTNAKSKT
jgi:hypothetical protein